MASENIEAFLRTTMDEVKEPKELPLGVYRFVVNRYNVDEKGKNNNVLVSFRVKAIEVLDSPEASDENLRDYNTSLFYEFWATEKAQPILVRFLNYLGTDPSVDFGMRLEDAIGTEFVAFASIEQVGKNNKDKAVIKRYLPMETQAGDLLEDLVAA